MVAAAAAAEEDAEAVKDAVMDCLDAVGGTDFADRMSEERENHEAARLMTSSGRFDLGFDLRRF